jgi:hypothetical protein
MINEAAALHYAAGCLADQDVPVGRHALGGVRVVLDFPASAAVERSEGTAGGGMDETKAPPLKVTLAAALLFIEECGLFGAKAERLWERCLREVQTKPEEKIPIEAEIALGTLNAERGEPAGKPKKTSAKRTDAKLATIAVIEPGDALPRRKKAA